jgi:hypothetical protein
MMLWSHKCGLVHRNDVLDHFTSPDWLRRSASLEIRNSCTCYIVLNVRDRAQSWYQASIVRLCVLVTDQCHDIYRGDVAHPTISYIYVLWSQQSVSRDSVGFIQITWSVNFERALMNTCDRNSGTNIPLCRCWVQYMDGDLKLMIPFAWRMPFSGVLRPVALTRTDDSEVYITSIIRMKRIGELRTTLAVTNTRSALCRSPIHITLVMQVIRSSETSVLTRATRSLVPERQHSS